MPMPENSIDNLFRESLKQMRVSPRKERKELLMEDWIRRSNRTRLRKRWLAAGVLLLTSGMITAGIILLFRGGETINEGAMIQKRSGPLPASAPVPDIKTALYSEHITEPEQASTLQKQIVSASPEPSLQASAPSREAETISSMESISCMFIPVYETNIISTGIRPANLLKNNLTGKGGRASHSRFHITPGVYYMPEWMSGTIDGNKFINNFGVETEFSFGPYSIRTGAGLSITRGSNENALTTQKYVGTYKILDSITFAWDERHYHLIPTHYFTPTDLYDTAVHLYEYSIIKEYLYLQIPLILGYDLYRGGFFSAGLRAGPVMSLLLCTKNLTPAYDHGRDRILWTNNITPERIGMNWQIVGGVNLSFLVKKRFSLSFEPEIRYYFNSVYEKSEIRTKPWSIGIRGAIGIKL